MEMLEGPLSAPKACVQGVGMAGEAMVRKAWEEEERGGENQKREDMPSAWLRTGIYWLCQGAQHEGHAFAL